MFPANSNNKLKESKSEDDEDDEKLKLSKHTSAQEMDLEDFFNQKSGPELVPKLPNHTPNYVSKNKVVAKPASCPRNRRRSRQDRNKSKPKKPNVLKELGPGTTIIVIQKSEDSSGNYNRKDIDDFTGLEEEIMKLKNGNQLNVPGKPQYRSENRQRKKTVTSSQSFIYTNPQKGKPPLKSPPHHEKGKATGIPRIGEKRTPVKRKMFSKTERITPKKPSQKSSRVNSIDSESQSTVSRKKDSANTKNQSKFQKQASEQQANKGIDELIQKKKEALGIKPLESTLSNYKAVINENQKLQKLVEEQKLKIKKLRQERVEQFKELNKFKEDQKKLELMMKQDTPVKARKIRSSYRNISRDTSNASIGPKTTTKSPNCRFKSENVRSPNEDNESDGYYLLKKSDTVKRLEHHDSKHVQQPKIAGKDHSQVITTELLKKSTQDLMQHSFSNLKDIQKICKMEQYGDNYHASLRVGTEHLHKTKSATLTREGIPTKAVNKSTKMSIKMSRNNEAYRFSPTKDGGSINDEESNQQQPKTKIAFEINADRLNQKLESQFGTPSKDDNFDEEYATKSTLK